MIQYKFGGNKAIVADIMVKIAIRILRKRLEAEKAAKSNEEQSISKNK